MKTIATAAVLMMLAAPTWADAAGNKQANDPVNSYEPILLSEAEMDGVTAGGDYTLRIAGILGYPSTSSSTDTSDRMFKHTYSFGYYP